MFFWAVVRTLWSAFLPAAVQLANTGTVCKIAFYGTVAEGYKQFFSEIILPEDPQEAKSLLCHFVITDVVNGFGSVEDQVAVSAPPR